MDRELAFEEHLLSRSYSSEKRIHTLLTTRYRGVEEGTEPYLALVPTNGGEDPAAEKRTDFLKNNARKPAAQRRLNTRKSMKAYIKSTLASQKKAVKTVQRATREGASVSIERVLERHGVPRYETFEGLWRMWRAYMQDLLFGDQKNPNLNMVLPKLSTADYNGCRLTVLESRDRNLVGMQGIVLYDSQHSFIMVLPQQRCCGRTLSASEAIGGLRVVAKKGTLFGFDVDVSDSESVGFTILGLRFELRAVDRSAKKFKSHNVDGLC